VRTSLWIAVGFLLMLPLFYMDFGDTEYPSLQKAEGVVRYVSSKRQLKRSTFSALAAEKTPSQFVKWMFSPMGSAEWYMVDEPGELSSEELRMIKKTDAPLLPPDVIIVPDKPNLEHGKQVVVKTDDVKSMLIVESYLDPKEPPVRTREWEFPKF
jgi:hypothetical protein